MTAGVLCVGRNSVDHIFDVRLADLARDTKQRTGEPARIIGGQCLNVAVTLAGLGVRVAYAGVTGDDAGGGHVRAALNAAGIDATGVEGAKGFQNPCAYIFVDHESGERSIVETVSPVFPRHSGDISDALCARVSHVYFDGHEAEASLRIARAATARGLATICDAETVTPETRALLASVETAIVPKSVASEIAGSDVPADMLSALAALGGRTHVVTMGAQGAIGALKGGNLVQIPVAPCHVTDTTGAGDAFHAGFIFAEMGGASFAKSMTIAARVAALACEHKGPSAPADALRRLGQHLSHETWIS